MALAKVAGFRSKSVAGSGRNGWPASRRSELSGEASSWTKDARAFWQSDSAALMSSYYRGRVREFLVALRRHQSECFEGQQCAWILSIVEDAERAATELWNGIDPRQRDAERAHRLRIFHGLLCCQFLPLAEPAVAAELSSTLHVLLEKSQWGAPGFTDSGFDQIDQMVPQILTDQLLSGPSSWQGLFLNEGLVCVFHARCSGRQPSTEVSFIIQKQFTRCPRMSAHR